MLLANARGTKKPQPSAALRSLKSGRTFNTVHNIDQTRNSKPLLIIELCHLLK